MLELVDISFNAGEKEILKKVCLKKQKIIHKNSTKLFFIYFKLTLID